MAAKKKKSAAHRHKQQQKKQQRRNSRLQKQRAPARPPLPSLKLDPTLAEDIRLIAPGGNLNALTSDRFAELLLPAALDSADLSDQPEFADIAIPPLEATKTYMAVIQERGVDAMVVDEVDEEEQQEAIAEALEEVTARLLTPALRQQLRTGLINLRARLRRTHDIDELPRVAAVQIFLESDQDGQMAANLGLVQEIVRRSILLGLQIGEAVHEQDAVENSGGKLTPASLYQRAREGEAIQQLTATLDANPSYRRFLEEKSDEIEDAGRRDLFAGRLRLDLYTEAEIAVAAGLFKRIAGDDPTTLLSPERNLSSIAPMLIPQLADYVRDLFAAEERFDQLRQRMDEVVADSAFADSQWAPFLLILHRNVREEDAFDYIHGYLVAALFGELWPSLFPPEAFVVDQSDG